MIRPLFALLLIALLAVSPCHAASKRDSDAAKAAWSSLLAAINAKDQNRAQTFVGKTVRAEGGRHEIDPNLCLALKLADGRLLTIRLTPISPASRVGREIRKVQKWSAPFVEAAVVGPVRSIDLNKPEIVVEPVSAGVTAAQ